ncbi:MAG: hypothetical protein FJX74_16065 [Armatimonadetes bacterium]|nr:hypothetical protein [Armatimonadota bacterium]
MLRFLRTLGCWTVGSVSAEAARLFADTTRAEVLVEAAGLGAELIAAAAGDRRFPEQQAEHDEFRGRMQQLVTFRREEWPYEYEYWQAAGRL